jgi:hypothetical protein
MAGSSRKKVQLMYQQREKFSSLNLLPTSFAKRQWQQKNNSSKHKFDH